MKDPVFERFLDAQFVEAMQLARDSDILRLLPIEGVPPQRYIAEFTSKGLVRDGRGEVCEAMRFSVMVYLPDDYLADVHPAHVLTYAGPHPHPFHPNIRAPFVCAHIRPGTPLVQVLNVVNEIWTWQLYHTADEGLNHEASQWARHQDPRRFPIDKRPLKRRSFSVNVRSTGGATS